MSVRRIACIAALLAVCVAPAFLATPARAKGTAEDELRGKRRKALLEAGQRHLEIGVWARDQGLVPQATAEFIRAVEVSDGQHPGANKVLSIMQRYDEAFWKKRRKKPHQGLLDSYEKRAAKAAAAELDDRLDIARWASKKSDLADAAYAEYVDILRDLDRPLELDDKGTVVIGGGPIPDALSARVVEHSVTINGKRYVRDAFLEKLPEVGEIHEAVHERVRVRTMKDDAQAADVLALALALLPQLEEETGGRPTRRMNVFVFTDKKTYDAYFDAAGLSEHKVAAGLAVSGMNIALVNGGGRSDEDVRGIALHELSHLFDMGVTRGVMPSWYREGFAETFGGTGTFAWDGTTLTLGGKMASFRLGAVKDGAQRIPLRELFTSSAHALLTTDRNRAAVFYAESWALMRYFREGATDDVREAFDTWQAFCRGAAIGAKIGDRDASDGTATIAEFERLVGPHLDRIETEFATFVESL